MSTILIGGHSRNVGKTSVVAGLIAALPEFHWTAAKVTQYGHGVCSTNGEPCDCATADHAWAITEERNRTGDTDTSRFLLAGANKVFWVRTEQGRLAEAMPAFRQRIAGAKNLILESNSILKFLRPDLYLTILDPATEDFKASAREFLDRADAIILHEPHAPNKNVAPPAWENVSLKPVANRPTFKISPPDYLTPEIVNFVRARLNEPVQPRRHSP